jgi:hypothetical protein
MYSVHLMAILLLYVYDPNNKQQLNALRSLGNVSVKRLHCRGCFMVCFMDALSANFFGNSEVKRAIETSLMRLRVVVASVPLGFLPHAILSQSHAND